MNEIIEANLRTYERRYKASGNPLYVWNAISECEGEYPEWVREYLTAAAPDIANGIDPKKSLGLNVTGGRGTQHDRKDNFDLACSIGLQVAVYKHVHPKLSMEEIKNRVAEQRGLTFDAVHNYLRKVKTLRKL